MEGPILCFGAFEVHVRAGQLRKHGQKIRIPEQSIQILVMLLEHPGEVVLREEIRDRLWPNDTVVEFDHSINAAIKKLRQSLGESAKEPRYVETLARRGYRFLGEVEFRRADQTPATPSGSSGLVGQTISHYRVLERLGGGGTCVVYRAEDNKLGRQVALKLLREDLAHDPALLMRFEREARAASALNHPNICTIYEVEEWAGQPVIAMELLEGETLDGAVHNISMPELIDLSIQIVDALDTAHAKGIIHRDLKPSNIFVTARRQAKVLDFGVAKLAEDQPERRLTESGAIVGTPAYMSPEQARGENLDARSDLFSFGSVLYEMTTGRRAFDGGTQAVILEAILNRTPVSPAQLNSSISPELAQIINKALEKDRDKRYQQAAEIRADLNWLKASEPALKSGRAHAATRRRHVMIASVLLAMVLGAVGFFKYRSSSEARLARQQIPTVSRLFSEEKYLAAFDLLAEVQKVAPDDPRIPGLHTQTARSVTVETDPPGAAVYFQDYTKPGTEWRYLGQSPLSAVSVPFGTLRWKFDKPGFLTRYRATIGQQDGQQLRIALLPAVNTPPDMVNVPPARVEVPGVQESTMQVAHFQIDRYEVTNKQFKKFLEAGGYERKEFWKQPFRKGLRTLTWEEAVREFVDTTGRPGPATWEAGSFPDGKDDFPVSGVSWYEAAAYAEFVGKSLPTVYHWYSTADLFYAPYVALWSNFGSSGPARVGQYKGEGPFGTFDLAGNVGEWCWNETHDGSRFILGGSWRGPSYDYIFPSAQPPFDRSDTNGFRCMRYIGGLPDSAHTKAVSRVIHDYSHVKPASDVAFEAYRSHYSFDRNELNPVVESVQDNPGWKQLRVVIAAAYGSEKLPLYIVLPKTGKPLYQAVVYHPGSEAMIRGASSAVVPFPVDYIVRAGRAVVLPVLSNTYERFKGQRPRSAIEVREESVRRFQDIVRTLEYVETRSDIDKKAIAYLGYSWGAAFGPIVLAMEPRFKAGILQSGGFGGYVYSDSLPEDDPVNFAPRVRIPILMVNGRFDYAFPVETAQKPFFRALGTPDKDKRYVIFDTAHEVQSHRAIIMREVLEWLDRYLGPVNR